MGAEVGGRFLSQWGSAKLPKVNIASQRSVEGSTEMALVMLDKYSVAVREISSS